MSIALTDIPDAVSAYLANEVIMTVRSVTPDDPKSTVLNHGDTGRFSFFCQNGDADKGFRLLNVIYHLTIDDGSVLKFISPDSAVIEVFEDLTLTTRVTNGKKKTELVIRDTLETTLDKGDVSTALFLPVFCAGAGTANITVHVHADIDQKQLFPNSRTFDGTQAVETS
jgi:hypothetical protein